MKKFLTLALIVPFVLGGCGKDKKKKHKKNDKKSMNMPLASADAKSSFFDEEVEAFVLENEFDGSPQAVANNDQALSWVADTDTKGFQPIYFEFDRHSVRDDQKDPLDLDVKHAKKTVGKGEKLVVEGHACHSAGSKAYNLLISEQRAQEIAQRLEDAGVKDDSITIVGRGTEMPVVLGGDKNAQAPNRRVELFPLAS